MLPRQVPFPPEKAVFAGIDVLLAVRLLNMLSNVVPYNVKPGCQWGYVKL